MRPYVKSNNNMRTVNSESKIRELNVKIRWLRNNSMSNDVPSSTPSLVYVLRHHRARYRRQQYKCEVVIIITTSFIKVKEMHVVFIFVYYAVGLDVPTFLTI